MTSLGRIDTELLAGAVGSEDGSKVDGIISLVLEELEEIICWGVDVGKPAFNTCFGCVCAADQGWNNWSSRTGNNGVGPSEVDHISNANLVLGSQTNKIRRNRGKSTILATEQLEL